MAYYIGPRCSACHYCFNECPVGAIRFVGDSYSIDEFKCIGCGKCAEVCPAGIIYDPEQPETPAPHEPQTMEADLVVLGAGGSGLVSAVRFAQKTGKKVIVLEKSSKVGGNTNLGHGFLMRYTGWHEKAGLKDTRREFIDELYENTGKVLDYTMLENATYALSDMFDWLCEFGGAEDYFLLRKPGDPGVPPGIPFAMIDFPKRMDNVKSSDTSMGPGWMGTYVVRKMMEEGKKLGVEVYTRHRAVKLLTDETGAFSGVVAENPGGILTVHAPKCIIATGGFAHNDAMMEMCNPSFFSGRPVKRLSVASTTGDAIEMVKQLDGKLDFERLRVPAGGPVHHPYDYTVMNLVGFGAPQVGYDGKFHEFGMGGGGGTQSDLDHMEGGEVFAILDMAMVEKNGKDLAVRNTDPAAQNAKENYLRELNREASMGYGAKKAYTLEGLAEKLHLNPTKFVEEVAAYNKRVEEENAAPQPEMPPMPGPFGPPPKKEKIEKAPFYAIANGRFSESASGGIVTDTYLHVLKNNDEMIPGLYAVGDTCRGLFLKYNDHGKFGEMPWAMASGFMAGNYAAEDI